MGMGALLGGSGVLGFLGGKDEARRQEQFHEESAAPKPYHERTTTGPAPWLEDMAHDTRDWAREIFGQRMDEPWRFAPPTFQDSQNRYRSSFMPNRNLPRPPEGVQEQADQLREEHGDDRAETRINRWYERQGIPSPSVGGGFGGGLRGGGRGGGGGGGGGFRGDRDRLASFMTDRATQGRDPQVQGAMDFLSSRMGSPFSPGPEFQEGLGAARRYNDSMYNPGSALQQTIGRAMHGGLNQAAPMYRDVLQGMQNRPEVGLDPRGSYLDNILGLALGGGRLFDF